MAEPDGPQSEPQQTTKQRLLRRVFGSPSSRHQSGSSSQSLPPDLPASLLSDQSEDGDNAEASDPLKPTISRPGWGAVVPGLPRMQTFKRRLSEERAHLAPIQPSVDERRAVSMDRRSHGFRARVLPAREPRDTLSDLASQHEHQPLTLDVPSLLGGSEENVPDNATSNGHSTDHTAETADTISDAHSISDSEYEAQIRGELEKRWILNLSMHFKDQSRREKFFVTYRQSEHTWRRVTVSLDYRNAPPNSLEMDLIHTKFQRDKNQKIYEAIRESLLDIHFFDTVTNLKLETTEGRLHVHVVEDGNEIIPYPPVSQVAHLGCRRIRESDVEFHSHMSGFVYKVNVGGEILIKKEIPSPETIEEFLYEINALNSLGYSENVINFHGVVVDEYDEYVKGLLISYADGGALIDVIYDNCKDPNGHGLAWAVRERWARQIVSGLGDIHESGFVQGDFTLSNIVIDHKDDAKIIDINRRGCPVGWEPPEATPLLDSNHRISMYIGIKSDLYQLGMVLWALAMEDDEPDLESRPLLLGPEAKVPDWYRVLTETCLNPDPRRRLQASQLAQLFPPEEGSAEHISVDDGLSLKSYYMDECGTVRPPGDWSHYDPRFLPSGPPVYESWNYAPRGRSPPSPLPSNPDMSESHRGVHSPTAWAARRFIRPSYSDAGVEDIRPDDIAHSFTPTPTADRIEFPQGDLHVDEDEIDTDDEHHSVDNTMTESKNNALMDEQVLSESSDVYQASDREDSDAGGEIANIGDKEEASYDVEKPTDFSDTEDALAPDETKVAEVEVLQAKETNPSAIVDDESVENATADMDTPETANLGENEVDDLVVSKDHAAEHDEVEKTSPDTKEEDSVLSNGHISEAENGDAVTAAPAVVLLEPKAENNIDLAPKDGIDRHTSEENPDGGTIAPPPTHDAEEDPSGVKGNEDAMKVTDTSTPIQLPEQPAEQPGAQPELTVNKEDDIRTENGPLANPEGPELQPDGPAEQAPGQQEMPASESCPPGKLDVSELVSGEDVQGPQSSDPPDDSNPPDQQSGIQAEQTIPEMPTVAETDDQVIEKPTPEVASNGATTTDNNAADSQALVDTKSELGHEVTEPGVTDTETSPTDLPDSLAGVGSGLPTVETDMLSEQNYIYDDDFHATKQPEPLTT